MLLRKPSSIFLSFVVMALLLTLTVGVVGGDGHIITDEYNNVEPDGYWTAEVAAGGHQKWSFDLAEPRDHDILITIVEPAGASLSVTMDGEDLGSVSDGKGHFTISLEAGSHALTIANSGEVPVQYDLYMGFVSCTFPCSDLVVDSVEVIVRPPRVDPIKCAFTVIATIQNIGPDNSGTYDVQFRLNSSPFATRRVAGGTQSGGTSQIMATIGGLDPGIHSVTVIADSGDDVSERNETNNQSDTVRVDCGENPTF